MFKLSKSCIAISSVLLMTISLSACKDTSVDIDVPKEPTPTPTPSPTPTPTPSPTPTPTNTAPVIHMLESSAVDQDLAIELQWTIADGEQDSLTCEIDSGDNGNPISISDCVYFGQTTLSYSAAGQYQIKLSIDDGEFTTEQTLDVTISEPQPQFTLAQSATVPAPIYLRGFENDWGITNQLTLQDGIYVIEFDGTYAQQAAKVASEDWSTVNCGGFALTANTSPIDLTCGGNPDNGSITFEEDAIYRIGVSYQDDGSAQMQMLKIAHALPDESGLGQAGTLNIHYLHSSESYSGWGLHIWGDAIDASIATDWATPRPYAEQKDDYAVWQVPIEDTDATFNFIMHFGDVKSTESDLSLVASSFGNEIWIVQDTATIYNNETDARAAYDSLLQNLGNQSGNLDLSDVTTTDTSSAVSDAWVDSAQFAQIYVRAYQDSDGDGVGDIQGLISRLDYLKDNGINAIWLMPMMESSDNDHGYATTDYRKIESDYGSLDDFKSLLTEAHNRDIAIVLDYVINHSSNQNPLFVDAMSSANNDKRDWYIIQADKPLGWNIWGGDPWRTSPGGAYYAAFADSMPDYDLTNPEVIAFHQNNLKFWLNMGVDGFRFDAVGVLVENGKDALEDQPENHVIMKTMKDTIESYDNRYIVCESPSGYAAFANDNSCGRAFNFAAGHAIIGMAKSGVVWDELLNELAASNTDQMPMILANHDFFAGDRVWNQLSGNTAQYKVAAATYLLASSNPFTYYGEEIGLAAADSLSGDWSIRTPMSWTDDASNAGFTTGTPFRALSSNLASNNVTAQLADADSLLNYYRDLYQVRNDHAVIATGTLNVQSSGGDKVLKLVRTGTGTEAVILINYSDADESVTVDVNHNDAVYSDKLSNLIDASSSSSGELTVTVPAQSAAVFVHTVAN
ncbi:alpha-amylase family glycosyl hydrolase [Catenovulum sp. SX2]|uniref:alpha-amylase family glycosyl hydrolase n=1 Tax=Catenovulum sp. SX2 TaxID=3398614 RepID=UPI003F86E591